MKQLMYVACSMGMLMSTAVKPAETTAVATGLVLCCYCVPSDAACAKDLLARVQAKCVACGTECVEGCRNDWCEEAGLEDEALASVEHFGEAVEKAPKQRTMGPAPGPDAAIKEADRMMDGLCQRLRVRSLSTSD